MDKVTRHELKTDHFIQEVGHTLDYVSSHRGKALQYGGAALALVAVIAGIWYYRSSQEQQRQTDLGTALKVRDSMIGPMAPPGDPRQYFRTQPEKNAAIRKAMLDIATRHAGSNESAVANFHLGVLSADENKLEEAERFLKKAASEGSAEYSSMARWGLSEIYTSSNREKDAEAILREFVANPTAMVSKEQATIALAKLIAAKRPEEARKLVEPLSKEPRTAVQRGAASVMAELPAAPAAAPAPAKK